MDSRATVLTLVVFCLLMAQVSPLEVADQGNVTEDDLLGDKRPPCVLINNYCGKIVPGTGMRKECCGDLICYKNKCRRRTCC